MKTDGTPLHGSYFDLLNDKYPDLRKSGVSRRPAQGRRRSTASLLLVAAAMLAGAWWLSAPRPESPIRTAWLAVSRVAGVRLQAPEPPVTTSSPAVAAPQAVVASTPAAGTLAAPGDRGVEPSARRSRPPAVRNERFSEPTRVAEAASEVRPAALPPAPPPPMPPAAEPPVFAPARKLFSPPPEYPPAARQAGEEGMVVVAARIDETGMVTSTEVVRRLSPVLDRAAAETLAAWRFAPATDGGQPVASSYRVGFEFALRPAAAESGRDEAPGSGPAGERRAARQGPAEVGGDVRPPRRLEAPLPAYPHEAWVEGVTGDVLVRAVIDEQGSVTEVEVLKGLPYGMTEAALAAIRRWRFAPATRAGRPVAVFRNLSVRFET